MTPETSRRSTNQPWSIPFSTIALATGIAIAACGNSPAKTADGPTKKDGPPADHEGSSTGWTAITNVPAPVTIAIAPNTNAAPYTIYVGTAGNGVYTSTNGTTFTAGTGSPATVVAVAAMPQANVSFASLPDGDVDNTQNSGSSWVATSGTPPATIHAWISIEQIGPVGVATASGSAEALQGKAMGATWVASTAFGSGSATSIAYGGGTSPAAVAYVGVNGAGGGVFKSTDLGAATYTFTTTNFPETAVLSVATVGSAYTTVFAGTTGGSGLYVSTNSGSSWAVSASGLDNTTVNAIAVDPTNAMNMYVGTGSGVYKSTDGGSAWTLSGLATDSVTQLAILNGTPSTIYAVTSSSLYVNTDSGN
jgi:hypothetical protein